MELQLYKPLSVKLKGKLAYYMKSEFDEKVMVEAVLLKNRAAFEKLIRQYEGLVIHIVVPLIKNENDREDICQDIFLKVFEKLHTFQFRSKLSTWIGKIAYNTSINFLQKKKNILPDDIFNQNNGSDTAACENLIYKNDALSPERILIQKEESKLLKEAVNKLPPIQKALLLLFHQDELSLEEISVIIEMPLNTVKSHLFRGRKNLKEMLVQHKN